MAVSGVERVPRDPGGNLKPFNLKPFIDALKPFNHNRRVRRPVIGHFLALVSAVALIVSGALPPLHVHQENLAHRNAPLEHWHFGEHHHSATALPVFDDDDHDGPARFLDRSALPAAPTQQPAPSAVLNVIRALVVDPLDASLGFDASWLAPPSLGPPASPSLLRAPPSLV
jgi:hypothetical protein